MVIVPTLLDSVAASSELLEHLEVQALGNLDPHIHFALLSDFADADAAERAGATRRSLAAAREGIEALNRALRRGRRPLLPLPPRRASGTRSEGVWMGWERKRGKIEEFNRLLRGADRHELHVVQVGDLVGAARRSATASPSTATRACRATPRAR